MCAILDETRPEFINVNSHLAVRNILPILAKITFEFFKIHRDIERVEKIQRTYKNLN